MDDVAPTKRHEILEERANRDAFRLAILLIVLLGMLITVLGIAAWNSRILVIATSPAAAPASAVSSPLARWPINCRPVPTVIGGAGILQPGESAAASVFRAHAAGLQQFPAAHV